MEASICNKCCCKLKLPFKTYHFVVSHNKIMALASGTKWKPGGEDQIYLYLCFENCALLFRNNPNMGQLFISRKRSKYILLVNTNFWWWLVRSTYKLISWRPWYPQLIITKKSFERVYVYIYLLRVILFFLFLVNLKYTYVDLNKGIYA